MWKQGRSSGHTVGALVAEGRVHEAHGDAKWKGRGNPHRFLIPQPGW